MGHASKQMIYEVYGNYVEGLEQDGERIFAYVGKDFVFGQKSKSPVPFRDSTGDSFQSSFATYGTFRFFWSGKRDSNPRPSAWEADTLPLSYSRSMERYF